MTSVIMIVSYASVAILSTLPDLRPVQLNINYDNSTNFTETEAQIIATSVFDTIQIISTIWFMFETLFRFFSSPCYTKFIRSPLNILDFVSTTFGIVFMFIEKIHLAIPYFVTSFVYILRIVSLIRLIRHFKSLQILIYVFSRSIREIFSLFLYILLAVILFSSIVFLFETSNNPNTKAFNSIPATMWWAVITIVNHNFHSLFLSSKSNFLSLKL
jgi:hypothetical protein